MRAFVLTLGLLVVAGLALAQAPAAKPTPEAVPETPIDTSAIEGILRGEEAADAGQGFTYDAANRRDPFRSLLAGPVKEDMGERPPGLRGMGIEEIQLKGILRLPEGWVAMIQGTDNMSHMIRAGMVLYDGTVERVESNRVVFKLQVSDPKSLKPYREVVRVLQ
ncbi:MAG TPA: hypothetical protein P5234_05255 [Thermoanaerobaculaceae bacterium]|nr:hypothetical protein [Thermoanaerobaculaceae bacterium]HRS15642.1 hypothetical protein [Thermoanaerobaculaceae bacterium]